MEDQVAQRGTILLGPVLTLELPSLVILGVLPAAVEFVDLALALALDLAKTVETGLKLKFLLLFDHRQ